MATESSVKYMCITTNQPHSASNHNPTAKERAMVSKLNVVMFPIYPPDKFVQDSIMCTNLQHSVVIVPQPVRGESGAYRLEAFQ